MRSMIDLAELNGRPHNQSDGSFIISDVSNLAEAVMEADFGWGKAMYAYPVFNQCPTSHIFNKC